MRSCAQNTFSFDLEISPLQTIIKKYDGILRPLYILLPTNFFACFALNYMLLRAPEALLSVNLVANVLSESAFRFPTHINARLYIFSARSAAHHPKNWALQAEQHIQTYLSAIAQRYNSIT